MNEKFCNGNCFPNFAQLLQKQSIMENNFQIKMKRCRMICCRNSNCNEGSIDEIKSQIGNSQIIFKDQNVSDYSSHRASKRSKIFDPNLLNIQKDEDQDKDEDKSQEEDEDQDEDEDKNQEEDEGEEEDEDLFEDKDQKN